MDTPRAWGDPAAAYDGSREMERPTRCPVAQATGYGDVKSGVEKSGIVKSGTADAAMLPVLQNVIENLRRMASGPRHLDGLWPG